MASGKIREFEKYVFGGLIGILVGALLGRLVILVVEMTPVGLSTLVAISGWGGALVVHFRTQQSVAAIASLESLAKGFQTLCLRIVLWLLGAAALLGVVTVLSGSFDLVGRVAITALITAVAAAGLWPTLSMIDQERNWRAGMLGAAGVLSSYFLVLPSVWEIGYAIEESWWVALSILVTLPVGMGAMWLTHSRVNRLNGVLASLFYVAATYLFVTASWGSDWKHAPELVVSGIIVLGYGAAILITLIVPETKTTSITDTSRTRLWWSWRSIGVLAAVAAASLCLMAVWDTEILEPEITTNITIVTIVTAYSNILCMIELKGQQRWVRTISIAAAILSGAMTGITVFEQGPNQLTSMFGRIGLASGIVASTGLLSALILVKINSRGKRHMKVGPFTEIDAYCPCCGKRQTIHFGTDRCSQCHTEFYFKIQEPKNESLPHITSTASSAGHEPSDVRANTAGELEAASESKESISMPFLDD